MSRVPYFALWTGRAGERDWSGPYGDNVAARNSVPGSATSSLVTTLIPMTPGERAEASAILAGPATERTTYPPARTTDDHGEKIQTSAADVRFHSSDDMDGLRELADVMEPVAVVVRPDGSLDVYGYIGVVDQRSSPADLTR